MTDETEMQLGYLLSAAALSLSRMEQPALIMFCPEREGYSDRADWLAAQVGNATWDKCIWRENGQHSQITQAARDVIEWLHPKWLRLASPAFDLKYRKRFLGVFSQHSAQWFVLDHGENSVFLIGRSGELEYIGEAVADLDRRLGLQNPLLLKRIDPAALPVLQVEVPDFEVPKELVKERSVT